MSFIGGITSLFGLDCSVLLVPWSMNIPTGSLALSFGQRHNPLRCGRPFVNTFFFSAPASTFTVSSRSFETIFIPSTGPVILSTSIIISSAVIFIFTPRRRVPRSIISVPSVVAPSKPVVPVVISRGAVAVIAVARISTVYRIKRENIGVSIGLSRSEWSVFYSMGGEASPSPPDRQLLFHGNAFTFSR